MDISNVLSPNCFRGRSLLQARSKFVNKNIVEKVQWSFVKSWRRKKTEKEDSLGDFFPLSSRRRKKRGARNRNKYGRTVFRKTGKGKSRKKDRKRSAKSFLRYKYKIVLLFPNKGEATWVRWKKWLDQQWRHASFWTGDFKFFLNRAYETSDYASLDSIQSFETAS